MERRSRRKPNGSARKPSEVTRSQAGRAVLSYSGTDRQEIRTEVSDCGKVGDVVRMDGSEIAAAVMLVVSEANVVTSGMIDAVKSEARVRTREIEACLMTEAAKSTAAQPTRLLRPRASAIR